MINKLNLLKLSWYILFQSLKITYTVQTEWFSYHIKGHQTNLQ